MLLYQQFCLLYSIASAMLLKAALTAAEPSERHLFKSDLNNARFSTNCAHEIAANQRLREKPCATEKSSAH